MFHDRTLRVLLKEKLRKRATATSQEQWIFWLQNKNRILEEIER